MKFSDIATQLEAFAQAEIAKLEAGAGKVGEAIAEDLQKAEPVLEDAFVTILKQFGALASQIVVGLMMNTVDNLSGGEKHNLAVTTLVDNAAQQGVQILAADATALIKNTYLAVSGLQLPVN